MSRQNPGTTVLIGGAGYIGSVLTRRLLKHGRKVTLLDRLDFGERPLLDTLDHPRLELVRADYRNVETLRKTVEGAAAVIHLGAIVGDAACMLDEAETVSVNRDGVATLADVCRRVGVPRLLFASTCSVYGSTEEIVDETSAVNPVSLYAETKIDSENLLLQMRDERFHPTILRLGTAFGWSYRPRFDLVVNLLTAKAHFERRAVIFNGEQWRPFVHVRDIARAFETVLDAPLSKVSGEVFNVGSNRMNLRLSDLGRILQKRFPDSQVTEEETPDKRNYRVRFDKISGMLGFQPRTSLTEGVEEMRLALLDGQALDYRMPEYHNHLCLPVAV